MLRDELCSSVTYPLPWCTPRLACIQDTLHPCVRNPTLLIFAADHGITLEHPQVSAYPRQVRKRTHMLPCSACLSLRHARGVETLHTTTPPHSSRLQYSTPLHVDRQPVAHCVQPQACPCMSWMLGWMAPPSPMPQLHPRLLPLTLVHSNLLSNHPLPNHPQHA